MSTIRLMQKVISIVTGIALPTKYVIMRPGLSRTKLKLVCMTRQHYYHQ